MPFYFGKSAFLARVARLNVSKSGLSVSKRVGRVTVSSRGRVSVRVMPGLSFRIGRPR